MVLAAALTCTDTDPKSFAGSRLQARGRVAAAVGAAALPGGVPARLQASRLALRCTIDAILAAPSPEDAQQQVRRQQREMGPREALRDHVYRTLRAGLQTTCDCYLCFSATIGSSRRTHSLPRAGDGGW